MDFRVVVHDIHERALLTVLDRDVRDHQLIGQRVHQQVHVDELLRKQRVVLVVEHRLQLRRAGRVVDLIVGADQGSGGELLRVVAVIGFHGQVSTRPETLNHLRQAVLRQREQHRDRLQLRNDHQAAGVIGMDDVAGIDQPQSDDSRNRCGDLGVHQLQLGVLDVGHVLLRRRLILSHQRVLRVELLFRDQVRRDQMCVALDVQLGVVDHGLIARECRLRQLELRPDTGADDRSRRAIRLP